MKDTMIGMVGHDSVYLALAADGRPYDASRKGASRCGSLAADGRPYRFFHVSYCLLPDAYCLMPAHAYSFPMSQLDRREGRSFSRTQMAL